MLKPFPIIVSSMLLITACSDSSDNKVAADDTAFGLTAAPYTALQQVWAPLPASQAASDAILEGSLTIYQHTRYDDFGLGAELQPGQSWLEHRELAPDFPGEGDQRRSLAYIWAAADPQLVDEESPIRLDGYADLYRPHGQLTPQMFEAHVRTARRISQLSTRPFDFTVIAGDLTDTTQRNEMQWLLTLLNGGMIDPDSGIDDDPVPGPDNDFNDPFFSEGIDTPWYMALGNHDVVHVGGFGLITEELRAAAVGEHLFTGTLLSNVWAGTVAGDDPNHPVILDREAIIPADSERLPLYETEMLQMLYDADGSPAGHGLTQADVNNSRGYFSVYPIPDKPLRMIVLDTADANNDGLGIAHLGSMDSAQFSWLQQQLIAATDARELVIIVSHHRLDNFHDQGEVPPEDIRAALSASGNVVLHLTGHGHANRKVLQSVDSSNGYWELMTASTMDFPVQSRIVELVDEGNGYVSIYVTNFDHNSRESTLAHKGRLLAAASRVFARNGAVRDIAAYWETDLQSQNLLLRLELPDDVEDNLDSHDWPAVVESVETLANF